MSENREEQHLFTAEQARSILGRAGEIDAVLADSLTSEDLVTAGVDAGISERAMRVAIAEARQDERRESSPRQQGARAMPLLKLMVGAVLGTVAVVFSPDNGTAPDLGAIVGLAGVALGSLMSALNHRDSRGLGRMQIEIATLWGAFVASYCVTAGSTQAIGPLSFWWACAAVGAIVVSRMPLPNPGPEQGPAAS